jgi:glutaredoxin/glutathione-dependent peroxiredoxin
MLRVGDKLPDVHVKIALATSNEEATIGNLFAGKKSVLFAVPGAFTPTCSAKHVPGFLERADAIRAKGIELIACVSVNDIHVMRAWGQSLGALSKIVMIADGNGDFTRAMGTVLDGRNFGMGERSLRYAAIIEDGVIARLDVEEPGKLEVSTAEALLARL